MGDPPRDDGVDSMLSMLLDRVRLNRSRRVRGGVGGTLSTLLVLAVDPLRLWPLPRRSLLALIADAAAASAPDDDDDRRCNRNGNRIFVLLLSLSSSSSSSSSPTPPSSSASRPPLTLSPSTLSSPMSDVRAGAPSDGVPRGGLSSPSPDDDASGVSRLSVVRIRVSIRAACAVTNLPMLLILRLPSDERRRWPGSKSAGWLELP
jgi:hypothetical protein